MKSESNEEEKKSNNLELKVSSTTNETIELSEYKKPKATETVDLIKNEDQSIKIIIKKLKNKEVIHH